MSERGDSAGKDAPTSASTTKGSRGDLTKSAGTGSASNLVKPPTAAAAAAVVATPEAPTNAIVYENTYKLKPDRKFQSEPVRRIAEEVLQNTLKKAKFDPNKIADLSAKIGNEILAGVKKLEYDRYKIVVDVTIGEFKGQGIRVASRCLWDTTTDTYTSASFKNASLFAVAIVFGCYYE
ncbi:Tctex-1 family-domain-containing protein [Chytriomyces sp. MP71]|nr:Tctex-1 family-domain-containing protein [Chytriomyces sp. MP71]